MKDRLRLATSSCDPWAIVVIDARIAIADNLLLILSKSMIM